MKQNLGKKVMMILFIILIGSIFSGCSIRYLMNSTNTLKKEDAKEFTLEKTKLEAITGIDISTESAEIELIEAEDFYVEIDYTYWEETPEYSFENGILTFDDSKSFPDSYSINFSLNNFVKVYLPVGTQMDQVQLNNSSGKVTATGFIADKLEVNVSSGDFTLEKAAATQCDIRLSSGTSKLTDFDAGKMQFNLSSGNATFKNINMGALQLPDNASFDTFDISMSSGNVEIDGLNSTSTEIRNSSGNITCEDITSGKFDVSLSSGNVNISNADLKDISVSDSSGNVTLSLTGVVEDYTMDLNAPHGSIKVDGKSYDDNLILENGGTRNIKAATSSGGITIKFD